METLFLLPYAGGSSFLYHDWAMEGVRMVALDYPGHSMDDMLGGVPFLSSFDDLLSHMKEVLLSHLGEGATNDVAIFGHSMGGLLAYHIAAELTQGEEPLPVHLFLSAVTPPDVLDTARIGQYATEEGFASYLSRYGRLDESRLNSRIFRQYFQPVIRGDFGLISRYHESRAYRQLRSRLEAGVVPPIPTDVFYSPGDTIMCAEEMTGWSAYTACPVTMHRLAGDHFYIEEEDQRQQILLWMKRYKDPGAE